MLPGCTHQTLQREPQLRAAAAAVIYRRVDSCWLPALVVHQPNQLCRLDLLPGILPAPVPAAPMPGCTQPKARACRYCTGRPRGRPRQHPLPLALQGGTSSSGSSSNLMGPTRLSSSLAAIPLTAGLV
jgi:hypothetical protein